MTKLLIVIPAYNENQTILKVLTTLPRQLSKIKVDTLVVDDGSTDGTRILVQKKRIPVVSHLINRGLGAALFTGFTYALTHHYDLLVTFDADGQHEASEIPRLIEPLLTEQVDVVIGSRLRGRGSMPKMRWAVNWLSNLLTFALFGVWTSDSQSGMRAFNKKALSQIHLRSQKMEVSSEIFNEIRRWGLRLVEVPITSRYTYYSLKKGQSLTNAPSVFWKLLLQRLS